MQSLSLLTYNMHKGFTFGNRRFSLPAMQTAIHQLHADIVLLQEVQGQHTYREKTIIAWPKDTHATFLADTHYPFYIYGKNAEYLHGHHGNAILSRYPILTSENINVSTRRTASRSVLHAVIQHPLVPELHVLCVHFGLFKTERKTQLQTLSQRIAEHIPPQATVIVGGDFNDWLQAAAMDLEHTLKLSEVFKQLHGHYARSFPIWKPLFKLDRIYCRHLLATKATCLSANPWNKLSDHAALYAEFTPCT